MVNCELWEMAETIGMVAELSQLIYEAVSGEEQ